MADSLIQVRINSEVKHKADELFGKNGITTQAAIKMLLMQVANTGKTPFDDLF